MLNLNELNKEQKYAVENIKGPMLICSVAGSGKTKTITYKIANMIDQGVKDYNILGITFTNKAAKEMKSRVNNLVNNSNVLLCTFHKFGLLILRKYIGALGYATNFSIYDDDDQKKVVKRILKELKLEKDEVLKPRHCLNKISKFKREYTDADTLLQFAKTPYEKNIATIYKQYSEILFKSNSLDFDDMILLPVKLLEKEPTIKKEIQNQYTHILVDEYQDTDPLQYQLIKLLTDNTKEPNLTVVGDDDQSIYKFRGADVTNILNFKDDFPKAKIVKLEQNYRSTMNILNSAYCVISNNKEREDKKLWSDKGEGELVNYTQYYDDREEAKQVAEKIKALNDYKNTVILYRANYISRRFEEQLMRNKIPYSIRDSLSFYAREEIKDLMAYLKLLANPNDKEAFTRIINVPKRGIGPSTVNKILDYVNQNNISLLEAFTQDMGFKGKTLQALTDFINIINHLLTLDKIDDIYKYLVYESGYKEYLTEKYKSDEEDLKNKMLNIDELRNVTSDYIRTYGDAHPEISKDDLLVIQNMPAKTILNDFLNDLSLAIPQDNKEDIDNKVQLMTLHSSKGLEFDNVFIVGMNNKIFPNETALFDNIDELEEERRLCYVGITRAKKKLYLSSFNNGYVFGQEQQYDPSIFIEEIDKKYLKR